MLALDDHEKRDRGQDSSNLTLSSAPVDDRALDHACQSPEVPEREDVLPAVTQRRHVGWTSMSSRVAAPRFIASAIPEIPLTPVMIDDRSAGWVRFTRSSRSSPLTPFILALQMIAF